MRKTIIAGLLAAATLVPTVSQAQYAPGYDPRITPREHRELRRDRQDIRQERRDVQDARRGGDYRDVREQRQELRGARQEFREDRRDFRNDFGRDDWRQYRNQNRDLYRGGNFNYGFRYQQFQPGYRIAPQYFGGRYAIANPYQYRLPRVGYNQRWVRHYNDVVLVDYRRGLVIDVIRGFFF